jgi:hypothetical protein
MPKYLVTNDFVPDTGITFFETYEEAKKYLEDMLVHWGSSKGINWYIAKIIDIHIPEEE